LDQLILEEKLRQI